MGKVFEYAEIENGAIPNRENFKQAKANVVTELDPLVQAGEIYGAKIFGSVATGTPNERSDFDLVIVTESTDVPPALVDIIHGIKQRTQVGIEPTIIEMYFAIRGDHTIDQFFLEHIRNIPRDSNTVGKDPTEVLIPPALDHKRYLIEKMRRFREGLVAKDVKDKNKVLQRALEAPINVGRRTYQVLASLGCFDQLPDDLKGTVGINFRRAFRGTPIADGFDDLIEHDAMYTQLLRDAMTGGVSRKAYEKTVEAMFSHSVPMALRWTSELTKYFIDSIPKDT
jgi:hypothetical protein